MDTDTTSAAQAALASAEAAVDTLADLDPDLADTAALEDELARLTVLSRRIHARQTALIGVLHHRHATDLAGNPHPNTITDQRAGRDLTDRLVGAHRWHPTQAAQARRIARALTTRPTLAAAFHHGAITATHAEHALRLCDQLSDHNADLDPDELEGQLVAAAKRLDPLAFARHCRQIAARHAPDAADTDEHRRRINRRASMTTTDDGMLHLHARLSGTDAVTVAAAIHACRQPDGAEVPDDQRRRPEQTMADALVQACHLALNTDPDRLGRNVPSIVVTIDHTTLLAGHGPVDIDHLGTLEFSHIRRLLADARVARILTDPESLPLEAGRQLRTVPAALARALTLRDKGCIARHCRAPAAWCQIAHLDTPYRLDGQLSLANGALMCLHHHQRYDHHHWQLRWQGNRPVLHPPARQPTAEGPAVDEAGEGEPVTDELAVDEPAVREPALRRHARSLTTA